MLSIKQTQKALQGFSLDEEEAEVIRDDFYALAEIIFEKWMLERSNRDSRELHGE